MNTLDALSVRDFMKPDRRLLWLGISTVAASLILSMLFYEAVEPETSYSARIQSNRLLFFKNIRSSGYDVIEGDGFQVFTPKERSDSGWHQILVHWRADQAHILWVSDEASAKDPAANLNFCEGVLRDSAAQNRYWIRALDQLVESPNPDYVLRDYFELIGRLPKVQNN
jgi:hypothetical protein